MSYEDILNEVAAQNCALVEITGGEPLMQPNTAELVELLLKNDYNVLLETAGAHDISVISEKVTRIVDMKCPGSGMVDKNDYENLNRLTTNDELKFVVVDEKDFEWAESLVKEHKLEGKCTLLVSPVFGKLTEEKLADLVLNSEINFKLQLQLHKYIWGPDAKGV